MNKDRYFSVLEKALKELDLRFPVSDISQKTGYSESQVSRILNNKIPVSRKFFSKFFESYGLDSDEFLENGNYLELEKHPRKLKPAKITGLDSVIDVTGYYYSDVSASAGLDEALENDNMNRAPVEIPGWDKNIIFINVYGDSMYPKYNAGEIIGVKPVEFEYLVYGYSYVVVLNNGEVFIKNIKAGKDEDHLTFESINPSYPPKEFHKSLIKEFYSIKGVIKKEMM